MPHQFKTPRLANESVIVTPRVSSENRPYLPVGLMGLFCARKITTALQRLLRRVKNQGGCAARYWVLKRAPFRKLEFVCREEQWVDPIMYRHTASCERKAESKPKTKKTACSSSPDLHADGCQAHAVAPIASSEPCAMDPWRRHRAHSILRGPPANPKTGEAAEISARRVVSFHSSPLLKKRCNGLSILHSFHGP